MRGVTELGYLVLGVKDMPRWRDFAGDFLGLELVDGDCPDQTFLRTDFWHHRFILETDPVDDVTALGLRVAGDEEFEDLVARLRDEGVAVRMGSEEEAQARRVLRLMAFDDPLGNPLEVFHGPLVQFDKPFHPHRRMYGSFATGSGGMGHCQLTGTDNRTFLRFYRLLGMRGDIEYKVEVAPGQVAELAFVHCNDRDHTFAHGLPGPRRMNHIMFESTSFDDVAYTYDLARSLSIPITMELGRHSNDHQYSFYCETPSGFWAEYGWGSRPASHQTEYYHADFYGHGQPQP